VHHPFYPDKTAKFKSFEEYNQQISIQVLEDFFVVYERYIGNYIELGDNWCTFTEKFKDLFTENSLLIERSYDDPSITSVDQCLYDICMTVDKSCSLDNVTTIRGGKFAVYRFEGLIQDIFSSFQGIFNIWMPRSGYEMDERYGFDIYREVDGETMYAVMDLCLPIK
jgi:AraC family transcriptional regulator